VAVDTTIASPAKIETTTAATIALRQAGDIQTAPLKNSGPGHRDVVKTVGTLRNGRLAVGAGS